MFGCGAEVEDCAEGVGVGEGYEVAGGGGVGAGAAVEEGGAEGGWGGGGGRRGGEEGVYGGADVAEVEDAGEGG